jgi:hypothetical protein
MARCAAVLRAEFGVATASQPNISRWETGAIHRPQCVSELLAYCDAYGSRTRTIVSIQQGPGGPTSDAVAAAPAAGATTGEIDEFDRLASQPSASRS